MFEPDQKESNKFEKRHELVFIFFSGLIIGTLPLLNIIGITKEIDLSFEIMRVKIPFRMFIGVPPYPLTFLCTDYISGLYGKRRASYVVWAGFVLNI